MDRGLKIAPGIVLLVSLVLAPAVGAAAGEVVEKGGAGGPLVNTVGIRVTVSNVDPTMRSADLDLTMYTRGYGPTTTTPGSGTGGFVGALFFGYPALDYGDGSTVPYATLALTTSGGGPGGSNVYRSVASFSHTYPSPSGFGAQMYTARAAMYCVICFQSSYVLFPPGSPVPTAFTGTFDLRPTNVIGNRPFQYIFSGTTYVSFLSTNVRYAGVYTPVVTNTAPVAFGTAIPTVSQWGLVGLGASLLGAGFFLMRRRV